MANQVGMESAQVRQLASQMDRRADEIDAMLRSTTARLSGLPWVGNDRNRFIDSWNSIHATKLRAVARGLREAAEKARFNANEQDRVSRSS